jgi:hypothetical protein
MPEDVKEPEAKEPETTEVKPSTGEAEPPKVSAHEFSPVYAAQLYDAAQRHLKAIASNQIGLDRREASLLLAHMAMTELADPADLKTTGVPETLAFARKIAVFQNPLWTAITSGTTGEHIEQAGRHHNLRVGPAAMYDYFAKVINDEKARQEYEASLSGKV